MAFLKRLFGFKSSVPTSDNFQVFYNCNGCFNAFEDGEKRYNCVDCVQSYDLCHKCYTSDIAETHTTMNGPHHTFVVETQSRFYASTLVHKADTLEDLMLNMFKYYDQRPAIGQYDKDKNQHTYLTYAEVSESVKQFASGLNKLLKDSGAAHTMVSMCSIARLEWYLTDIACILLSLTTVPLGANSNKEQMSYILRKAEVSTVVCSASTLEEITKVLSECPGVKTVILMDAALNCAESSGSCDATVPESVRLVKFTEVMALGKKYPTNLSKIKHNPSDIYSVQFTSGSTGDPKGCIFTRGTWKKRIDKGTILGHLHIWLSFHPPSHNLERTSFLVTLLAGGKVGLYRGSMEHLFDDFALVRPTYVSSTPRLWTMLYNQYLQEVHDAYIQRQTEESAKPEKQTECTNPEDRAVEATAVSPSLEHFDIKKVPKELRREVMQRFKSKLGGREQRITTGGAPTAKAVKKFIINCFAGMVSEGYGSTEVGAIAHEGSVVSQVKLKDVPEMGYFTSDNPPRGEICVKSKAMIDGYFKSPEVTKEKFVDGYFLTGDIGVMDGDGKVQVIDRKKNIFKLSQGEFVSPERLENIYVGASSYIGQIYVYGNSLQENVVAVVVPEHEEMLRLGETIGENNQSIADLCRSETMKKALVEELRRIGSENSLPGWEIPVDIILDPDPFTVENGLLTSTLKKSRPKLEQKYKLLLEELYEKINSANGHKRPLEIVVFEWLKQQLHHGGSDHDESRLLLDQEKSFSQLGGDSLAAMHLSSLLREHLSLDLPVDVILKAPLAHILTNASLSREEFKATGVSYNWVQEASLDSLELGDCPSLDQVGEYASTVLLTGATGFLGRFILWELMENTRTTKIFCLAQNKNGVSAEDRVMQILRKLQAESGNTDSTVKGVEKLIVMSGDLSLPNLGLESEDYTRVCDEVDTIIHNGATVNHVLPYSAMKSCNVESTKTLLHIAVTSRPKFLHYVSTIGVFSGAGRTRVGGGKVDESVTPSVEGLDRLPGYSQSKWVAESLVLAAIAQGKIMGTVSRPGLIGPHTITGHANFQDWVYWIVQGLVKMRMAPVGEGCEGKKIYWVPVNQVAKAIVLTSCDHRGWTNIIHLVNTNTPVTFTTLVNALMCAHPEIKTTGYRQFRDELKKLCRAGNDQVLGSLDLLLPTEGGWPNSSVYHSESHKAAKLTKAGVHLEQIQNGYIQQYLNYILL